jgi:hypothetical protein
MRPEVVQLGNGVGEADLLVHDEANGNLAFLLAQMDYPEFPVPFGVIYRVVKPTYEEQVMEQIRVSQKKQGSGDLRALYHADYTWSVEAGESASASPEEDQPLVTTETLDEAYIDTVVNRDTGDTAEMPAIHTGLATDPLTTLLHDHPLIATAPRLAQGRHRHDAASLAHRASWTIITARWASSPRPTRQKKSPRRSKTQRPQSASS